MPCALCRRRAEPHCRPCHACAHLAPSHATRPPARLLCATRPRWPTEHRSPHAVPLPHPSRHRPCRAASRAAHARCRPCPATSRATPAHRPPWSPPLRCLCRHLRTCASHNHHQARGTLTPPTTPLPFLTRPSRPTTPWASSALDRDKKEKKKKYIGGVKKIKSQNIAKWPSVFLKIKREVSR